METVEELLEVYRSAVIDAEVMANVARSSRLQLEGIASARKFGLDVKRVKARAVAAGDEDFANVCLGCECVVESLCAEIGMWVFLKDSKPEQAWDSLIDAQEALDAAARAHGLFFHVKNRAKYLAAIERLVFPPQSFASAGFIVDKTSCSICNGEYGECVHIAGRPYMGKFCTPIIQHVARLDHVALVDHPADKRCRVISFSQNGGNRNKMTWEWTDLEELQSSEWRIV